MASTAIFSLPPASPNGHVVAEHGSSSGVVATVGEAVDSRTCGWPGCPGEVRGDRGWQARYCPLHAGEAQRKHKAESKGIPAGVPVDSLAGRLIAAETGWRKARLRHERALAELRDAKAALAAAERSVEQVLGAALRELRA